jgi:hypothetical protein
LALMVVIRRGVDALSISARFGSCGEKEVRCGLLKSAGRIDEERASKARSTIEARFQGMCVRIILNFEF